MLGWLHATPEKRKETRYQDYVNRNKHEPPMPEVECGEHLIDYLMEVGPAFHNGMGPVPVPFFEIESWSRMTATTMTPWEAQALRELSQAYVVSMQQAEKPNCPAPWAPKEAFDREAIAAGMKGLLAKISAKRGRNGLR